MFVVHAWFQIADRLWRSNGPCLVSNHILANWPQGSNRTRTSPNRHTIQRRKRPTPLECISHQANFARYDNHHLYLCRLTFIYYSSRLSDICPLSPCLGVPEDLSSWFAYDIVGFLCPPDIRFRFLILSIIPEKQLLEKPHLFFATIASCSTLHSSTSILGTKSRKS